MIKVDRRQHGASARVSALRSRTADEDDMWKVSWRQSWAKDASV
ncbi:hypothetical protein [[Actinomadura] parvosata]|nr:hypothetical protein [Nonomuraea sp. ATCC 55076]